MEGKNSSEKTPSIGYTKSRGVTSILLSTTLTEGPRVRRLVLAEKFSAARRLAQILSEGKTARVRADGITYFQFSRQGDEYTLFPLRGHVVEIDYPADVQDWKSTDLDYLIDLEPVRHESPPALHDMLRLLADATDEVILATDYDREGELIGVEALETLRSRRTELPAKRARFSAMSPSEVRRSFENLTEPDWALAEAAAARQRIDLAWGAVLTRFLTVECASDRQVLSAGRVQTPTLRIVADREREREDFVPRTFWNVVLKSGSPALEATAVGGPFWDREGAQAVVALAGLGGESATVARIELSQHREPPPAPFNTTSLLAKASREGISAARAMAAAQDLYVHGEISYPRTDNTVYPPSLPVHDPLKALPPLSEGDVVPIQELRIVEERTKPPPLHSQGSLLLAMQRLELGTKSTRHEILDLLFRRQFVSGRSMRTTAAGRALVDALAIYGPDLASSEMTRHLEDRMTAIAEGHATLDEVVGESRRALHGVVAELRSHRESLSRWLKDATFLEKDYGPCDACGQGRMTRRRARNGWAFLGCSRYPACKHRMRLNGLGQRLPWELREAETIPIATPATA